MACGKSSGQLTNPLDFIEQMAYEKAHLEIAVLGQVKSGKSTLTAAITNVLYHRLGYGTSMSYEKVKAAEEKLKKLEE